jgi:hypothetical protein
LQDDLIGLIMTEVEAGDPTVETNKRQSKEKKRC